MFYTILAFLISLHTIVNLVAVLCNSGKILVLHRIVSKQNDKMLNMEIDVHVYDFLLLLMFVCLNTK